MTARAYLAHVAMGAKLGLQYKFHLIINFLALPVSLTVYYFLWKSIYAYSGAAVLGGYALSGLLTYYVLSMLLGLVVWSDADAWMEEDVRHGEAIAKMLLPGTYMARHFWTEMGLRLVGAAVSALPILGLAILAFGARFPLHAKVPLALLSLGLAMLLYFLLSYLIGLTAFWLKKVQGLRRVKRAAILFFSGGMIPLAFFPAWWQPVSKLLPFEYIRAVPIGIYQGTLSAQGWPSTWLALVAQASWVLILYALAKAIERRAFAQLEGAGT